MFSQAALDPYDLADPEEMLGKMPKDFYEKLVRPDKHSPVFCCYWQQSLGYKCCRST